MAGPDRDLPAAAVRYARRLADRLRAPWSAIHIETSRDRFVAHAGKVLTHRFILRKVWGGDADVQYLRVYIRALRHKVEPNPEQPHYILTEQGVGYRMRPPNAEPQDEGEAFG